MSLSSSTSMDLSTSMEELSISDDEMRELVMPVTTVYNLTIQCPKKPNETVLSTYKNDCKKNIYRCYIKNALDREDVSDIKIRSVLRSLSSVTEHPDQLEKDEFDWLPQMETLLQLSVTSGQFGITRVLKMLFEMTGSDVQWCMFKNNSKRAGRLADILKKFLISCHMKVTKRKLMPTATSEYTLYVRTLMSYYVDLCCVYSSEISNKKLLGQQVCGFTNYVLIGWPERLLEVLVYLHLSIIRIDTSKVLLPLVRRCLSVKPAGRSYSFYLKYILLVRIMKHRIGSLEIIQDLVAFTKDIPAGNCFREWLQWTCPECAKRFPLDNKNFVKKKVTRFLLMEADIGLVDSLLSFLYNQGVANVGGCQIAATMTTDAGIYFLDTALTANQELVSLNTVDDLELLLVKQDAHRVISDSDVDPDDQKLPEADIQAITEVSSEKETSKRDIESNGAENVKDKRSEVVRERSKSIDLPAEETDFSLNASTHSKLTQMPHKKNEILLLEPNPYQSSTVPGSDETDDSFTSNNEPLGFKNSPNSQADIDLYCYSPFKHSPQDLNKKLTSAEAAERSFSVISVHDSDEDLIRNHTVEDVSAETCDNNKDLLLTDDDINEITKEEISWHLDDNYTSMSVFTERDIHNENECVAESQDKEDKFDINSDKLHSEIENDGITKSAEKVLSIVDQMLNKKRNKDLESSVAAEDIFMDYSIEIDGMTKSVDEVLNIIDKTTKEEANKKPNCSMADEDMCIDKSIKSSELDGTKQMIEKMKQNKNVKSDNSDIETVTRHANSSERETRERLCSKSNEQPSKEYGRFTICNEDSRKQYIDIDVMNIKNEAIFPSEMLPEVIFEEVSEVQKQDYNFSSPVLLSESNQLLRNSADLKSGKSCSPLLEQSPSKQNTVEVTTPEIRTFKHGLSFLSEEKRIESTSLSKTTPTKMVLSLGPYLEEKSHSKPKESDLSNSIEPSMENSKLTFNTPPTVRKREKEQESPAIIQSTKSQQHKNIEEMDICKEIVPSSTEKAKLMYTSSEKNYSESDIEIPDIEIPDISKHLKADEEVINQLPSVLFTNANNVTIIQNAERSLEDENEDTFIKDDDNDTTSPSDTKSQRHFKAKAISKTSKFTIETGKDTQGPCIEQIKSANSSKTLSCTVEDEIKSDDVAVIPVMEAKTKTSIATSTENKGITKFDSNTADSHVKPKSVKILKTRSIQDVAECGNIRPYKNDEEQDDKEQDDKNQYEKEQNYKKQNEEKQNDKEQENRRRSSRLRSLSKVTEDKIESDGDEASALTKYSRVPLSEPKKIKMQQRSTNAEGDILEKTLRINREDYRGETADHQEVKKGVYYVTGKRLSLTEVTKEEHVNMETHCQSPANLRRKSVSFTKTAPKAEAEHGTRKRRLNEKQEDFHESCTNVSPAKVKKVTVDEKKMSKRADDQKPSGVCKRACYSLRKK